MTALVSQFEIGSDDDESGEDDYYSSSAGNAKMKSAARRKRFSLSGAGDGDGMRKCTFNESEAVDHDGGSEASDDRDYFVLSDRSTRLLERMRKRISERSSSATAVEQQQQPRATKSTTESEIASPKKLFRDSSR